MQLQCVLGYRYRVVETPVKRYDAPVETISVSEIPLEVVGLPRIIGGHAIATGHAPNH